MIRRIKKPNVLNNLCEDALFYEVYDAKGVFAHIGLEIQGDKCGLHSVVSRWSHNCAKVLKEDTNDLKNIVSSLGVKKVIASFPDGHDRKWPKFIQMFGFPRPTAVQISIMEV